MKKLLALTITAIFVCGAYAGNGEAKEVKVTNYQTVLSNIEYPQVCRKEGIEGKVIVNLTIDSAGEITSSEFVSFPCTDLKEAVKNSLSQLEFQPARNSKGEAIEGKFILPVNFKLTL